MVLGIYFNSPNSKQQLLKKVINCSKVKSCGKEFIVNDLIRIKKELEEKSGKEVTAFEYNVLLPTILSDNRQVDERLVLNNIANVNHFVLLDLYINNDQNVNKSIYEKTSINIRREAEVETISLKEKELKN